jgi:hypothetical protein
MVSNELLRQVFALDAADREYLRNALDASLSDGLPPQLNPEQQ